jgi:hypothetical protein
MSLITLTFLDVEINGTIIEKAQLEHRLGTQLTRDLYLKIIGIARAAKTRYCRDTALGGVSLQTFFETWKKGSKKIRKVLTGSPVDKLTHNMIKFAETTENIISVDCAMKLNNLWTLRYYSNNLRVFLFKLHNNTLAVNTRLSHFVRGNSRSCTFCELTRNPDPEEETVFHFFYDCRTTERLRESFFRWLTVDNNFNLGRHEFFCCCWGRNRNETHVMQAVIKLFMQYLWESKLRRSVPELLGLKKFIFDEIHIMSKINLEFDYCLANSGINLNLERLQ